MATHRAIYKRAHTNYSLERPPVAAAVFRRNDWERETRNEHAPIGGTARLGWLTSSRPSHESQIVEAGHLVLEQGAVVAQVGSAVLVISRAQQHLGAVGNVTERQYFEGNRQSLIAPPVGRKDRADEIRAVGANQFSGVFG